MGTTTIYGSKAGTPLKFFLLNFERAPLFEKQKHTLTPTCRFALYLAEITYSAKAHFL